LADPARENTGTTVSARVRSHRSRRAWGVATWMLTIAFFALIVIFRPAAMGGFTTYVFVAGVSMEPTYHTGDLVVVMTADEYKTGDVVAYHPTQAPDKDIIHRIVGGDGTAGFVVQGDNVANPDFDKPTASSLVGRAVLWLPSVGSALMALRSGLGLGLLALVIGMAVAWQVLTYLERQKDADGASTKSTAKR
jgi:signal peptidase I